MSEALIQMAALILCGVVWRYARPGGLDATHTRTALTGLVYYLLLPALVLLVLWQAPLGSDSFKIAFVAASSVLVALLLMGWLCNACGMDRPTKGAAMLAAAFPNATYLGLPVLEATLGKASRSMAIQFDLFACTPLLLSVGVWLAMRYSEQQHQGLNLLDLFKVPALLAALLAVVLNLTGISMPEGVHTWLQTLGNGVVPLMLISLGLSLYITRAHLKQLRAIFPVLGVKLFIMPAVAMLLTIPLAMQGMVKQVVILEAAMPSMVIGLVLCDRYGLNTVVYAAAVTISTAVSFLTLGLWFGLVQG